MLGLNLNFVFVSMQTKGDHGCLLATQGGFFFFVLFFGAALSSQSTTPSDSQQPPTTCQPGREYTFFPATEGYQGLTSRPLELLPFQPQLKVTP